MIEGCRNAKVVARITGREDHSINAMRARLNEALALLHSGDSEKIGKALAILQGTVFAFSMKVCGHREDAEDTMQEVLLRSLRHLSKIEHPRALAVWLYTVTRNR